MIPGLTERLTSGGMPVLRLHYSAAPEKRPGTPEGDVWLAEASSAIAGGVTSPRWRKEMEIEWSALGGTKLFPEWEKWCRGPIVCDPFIPTGYKLYASYDHGWRNPSSFHIHGVSANEIVTFWEFYASQVPVHLIAKIILGEPVSTKDGRRFAGNPFAGQQLSIIADPSMWAEDVPMTDEPNKSVAELFRRAGVYMTKGERGGDTMVAEWLHGHYWRDPAQPLYRICSTCPKLIWEIGKLRHKEFSAKVALTRDQPEQFVSKDDHAWDGLKMFLQRFPPKPGTAKAVAPPATFAWWKQVAQKAQRGETLPTYRRQVVA
jgi:hypothetical protein